MEKKGSVTNDNHTRLSPTPFLITRWNLIKRRVSVLCGVAYHRREWLTASKRKHRECYWEHLVRDEQDFARHVDYIHYNAVKHGRGERVADWPHSTFHRYV